MAADGSSTSHHARPTSKKTADVVSAASSESDERPQSAQMNMVTKRDIDDTTVFYNTHKDNVKPIDAKTAARIDRKNFWCLLGQTWWVSFLIHLDEGTLGQASVMGLFDDVKMTKNEFNNTFVLYYTGYLVALWPGAMIAQRIGQKNFIVASLILWALILGMHPLVQTGKQLLGLRFLLGLVGQHSEDLCARKITNVIGFVTNYPVNHCTSSNFLPTQKEPMGAAALVVCWKFRERST